jgi:hypothetical protein
MAHQDCDCDERVCVGFECPLYESNLGNTVVQAGYYLGNNHYSDGERKHDRTRKETDQPTNGDA